MSELVLKLEHADSRGEIYSITLPGEQELMLLHSKEGSLRGGHAHDVDEVILLLTGRMRYRKRSDNTPEIGHILHAGATSFNEKMQYHMASFLADSWLLEWKLNTRKGGWKNIDYEPYRKQVRANASGGR